MSYKSIVLEVLSYFTSLYLLILFVLGPPIFVFQRRQAKKQQRTTVKTNITQSIQK